MLTKPTNVDDARKLAEICVRAKIPTRVLIVDDSGTMRSIVRKILSASRFALDIHEAAEGIAALNQLRGGNFGIVFLDYNMPGLNGIETLSEIKRESPNVAVVMMTSTVDNAIADRARSGRARLPQKAVLSGRYRCGARALLRPARADQLKYFGEFLKRRLGRLLPLLLEREFAVADARAEAFGESGGGFLAIGGDEFGQGGEQAGLRQAIAVDAVEARLRPRLHAGSPRPRASARGQAPARAREWIAPLSSLSPSSPGVRLRTPVPNPETDVSRGDGTDIAAHKGKVNNGGRLIGVSRGDFAGDFGAFVEIAANCDVGGRRTGAISLLKTRGNHD